MNNEYTINCKRCGESFTLESLQNDEVRMYDNSEEAVGFHDFDENNPRHLEILKSVQLTCEFCMD